jgi:predicted AlkP superfamily pyrophosphatase or phosphodiesterase
MKTKLVTPIQDAFYLRKRAISETIFDQLKNIFQVEHSRNRSQINYFNNIFSALIAYNFAEKKPSLKNNFVDTKQLILFQKFYVELTLNNILIYLNSLILIVLL